MEPEEIREMFRAGAMLRHLPLVDKQRPALEEAYEALSKRYAAECLQTQDQPFADAQPKKSKTPVHDAIAEMCRACQAASQFELACRPNNMTDEAIMALAEARQNAIDVLVDAAKDKIQAEKQFLPKTQQ